MTLHIVSEQKDIVSEIMGAPVSTIAYWCCKLRCNAGLVCWIKSCRPPLFKVYSRPQKTCAKIKCKLWFIVDEIPLS